MKRGSLCAIGFYALSAVLVSACRGRDNDAAVIPHDVIAELIAMGAADQAIRQSFTPESFADTALLRGMTREDSVRTERLKAMIALYGWPDGDRAGREASQAAFLILQHSPSQTFQVEMLPVIEGLAGTGQVPGQDLALLTDRVLKQQGSPQRYGTQFDFVGDTLVLYEVEDKAALEERRERMGLPPMSVYVEVMSDLYHAPVVLAR